MSETLQKDSNQKMTMHEHIEYILNQNKEPEPESNWNSEHPEPLPGQQYNDWTVIEDYRIKNKKKKDKIKARCACGVVKEVNMGNMIYGRSTSCGHNQYEISPEEVARRENVYENRIGEVFNGFTLQYFKRNGESTDRSVLKTYVLTCPNGHDHRFTLQSDPSQKVQNDGFQCWCQIKDPVDRMRERKGLTLKEIGKKYNITREAVRQYEVRTKNKKALDKKRHGRSNIDMMNDDYSFNRLALAYNLSDKERLMWIDEILYNRFYEYDEPKRPEFLKQPSKVTE